MTNNANEQSSKLSRNQYISLLKGLSIFSVICAHCNTIPATHNRFEAMSSCLLSNLGTVGVICFFVISGFLFHCESKLSFFIKKFKFLVLPWLFGAVAVYLYMAFRNPPISIFGFFNFLVGNGSYFYYITILLLLYTIFVFIPFLKQNISLVILIIMGVVSGVFFSDSLPTSPTPYLNLLNWVGYFSFGILIRKNLEKFSFLFKKILGLRWIVYLAYLGILIYQMLYLKDGWYFGFPQMFFAWCGALSFLLLTYDVKKIPLDFPKNVLRKSGDFSLFVYIWHMPVAGIIANVFSRGHLTFLVILRPFIVLTIVFVAMQLTSFVLKKFKWKKIGVIFGLKL